MKFKDLNSTTIVSVTIGALAIILCAFLLFSGERKSDYITVSGQSEVVVIPDQAAVYFSINTDAPTAQDAQSMDAALTTNVQKAIVAKGIAASAVETANYYLYPKTEWTSEGSIDKGYTLRHQFKVTTSNLNDTSKIIEVAVGAGANGVDNIDYQISPKSKNVASGEAMRIATLAAKVKAQKAADGAGAHLGRVLKVEEGSYWFQAPSSSAETIGAGSAGNIITPQSMAILMNVNVVFAVN